MENVFALDSSTNEDIFFCGPCKQVFKTLTLFLAHRNNECKKYYAAEPSEIETTCETTIPCSFYHKTQVETQDISCKSIKKNYKKTKTSLGHIKMHEKPYQCVICGRCFAQNSHLQRHVPSHKVWPDGISKTTPKTAEEDLLSYSCLYCDLTVPNFNQFRVHIKTHICLKKFKCVQNQCNSFYETTDSLMQHVSNAHKTVKFWCHNCNKTFNSLEEIAFHYQNSNKSCIDPLPHSKLFKCSQCDAIFKKPEKLSLHMLTETHKKACIHCNKIFASDKRLRLHLQVHRKLKPFQCNICGQNFHMKKYLSSHLLKHGENKYECKVCKSLFKRQDNLQRHIKSHQIRKMYKCPFTDTLGCKREFSRSDKLKSHIKLHTKKITPGSINIKPQSVSDTVEVCIVPLDSKRKE